MGKNVWGNSPKAGRLCYSASQSQRRTWFTHKESGQLDPDTVVRPEPGEWHTRMPERLDEEDLPIGAPGGTRFTLSRWSLSNAFGGRSSCTRRRSFSLIL